MRQESIPLDVDLDRLADICRHYGSAALVVFGSVARGESGPRSDVDLLYRLQPGAPLGREIEQLEHELAELFAGPVDLISAKSLHPRLRPSVSRSMQRDRLRVEEMIDATTTATTTCGWSCTRISWVTLGHSRSDDDM